MVDFQPPSGSTSTLYTVIAVPPAGSGLQPVEATASGPPVTLQGLTAGTNYSVYVAGSDGVTGTPLTLLGPQSFTPSDSGSAPAGAPSAPTFGTVSTSGSGASVGLSGLPVAAGSFYTVVATPVGGGQPVVVQSTTSPVTVPLSDGDWALAAFATSGSTGLTSPAAEVRGGCTRVTGVWCMFGPAALCAQHPHACRPHGPH